MSETQFMIAGGIGRGVVIVVYVIALVVAHILVLSKHRHYRIASALRGYIMHRLIFYVVAFAWTVGWVVVDPNWFGIWSMLISFQFGAQALGIAWVYRSVLIYHARLVLARMKLVRVSDGG